MFILKSSEWLKTSKESKEMRFNYVPFPQVHNKDCLFQERSQPKHFPSLHPFSPLSTSSSHKPSYSTSLTTPSHDSLYKHHNCDAAAHALTSSSSWLPSADQPSEHPPPAPHNHNHNYHLRASHPPTHHQSLPPHRTSTLPTPSRRTVCCTPE